MTDIIAPNSQGDFTQKPADSDSRSKQKPIQDVEDTAQSDKKYSIPQNSTQTAPTVAQYTLQTDTNIQEPQHTPPQSDPLTTQQQNEIQQMYKPLQVEVHERININGEPGNEEGDVVDMGAIKPEEELAHRPAPIEYFRDRIPLTTKQLLYIVVMQGLGSFAINFGINALVAWLIYRNIERIALAGSLTCIISDLAVTSFAVTVLTSLIGTVLVKNDLRQGKIVSPIDRRWLLCPIYKIVPTGCDWKSVLIRSIELGLLATLVYTLPTELIMIGAARNGMQIEWGFVIFKGIWGGVEGGLVGPYSAIIALATL